jgi:autotransporter translocation and assembly factor TamB
MKKKIAIIICVVILFMPLFYFVGNSSALRQFALRRAQRIVEEKLGLRLSVGHIRGNLFHHLTVDGIELGEAVSIESVEISYNLLFLVRKRIKISAVHISKPVVDVAKAMAVKMPKQEAGGFGLSVDSFVLTGGTIIYGEKQLNLSLRGSVNDERISLTDLSITLPNSEITLSGMVDLKDALSLTHSFQLDLRDLAVGEGKISLNGKTRGTVKNPVSSGDFSLLSERVGAVSFFYHYEDSVLTLRDIIITGKNLELRGEVSGNILKRRGSLSLVGTVGKERITMGGSMEGERMELQAESGKGKISLTGKIGEEIDVVLKGAFEGNPFKGTLRYSNGNLEGTVSAGRIELTRGLSVQSVLVTFEFFIGEEKKGSAIILVNGIRYETKHAGDIRVDVSMGEEKVHLTFAGLINGQGTVALKPPEQYSFSLRMDDLDFGALIPDAAGNVSISARIAGTLSEPQEVHGSIMLKELAVLFRGIPVSLREPMHISLKGMKAFIQQSILSVGGSIVRLGGTVPLGGADGINFETLVEDFDLAIVNVLVPDRGLTGRSNAHITITGSLRKPLFQGKLTVNDVFFAMKKDTVGPVQCNVVFNRDTVAITQFVVPIKEMTVRNNGPIVLLMKEDRFLMQRSAVSVNGNVISFEGEIPVREEGRFNVTMKLEDFALAALNALIPTKILDGVVDADILLTGAIRNPEVFGGLQIKRLNMVIEQDTVGPVELDINLDRDLIEITYLTAMAKKSQMENNGPIRIRFDEQRLSVEEARITIGQRDVTFSGIIQRDEDYIDFTIRADSLDLSTFSPLIPRIDLQGFVTFAITAMGPLADPVIAGNADILSVYAFMAKDTIGPANGKILFAEGIAQIPELSIGYQGGRVVARGNIGINRKAELTINIRNISVPFMKRSNVALEGDLRFAGTVDSAQLAGELVITGAYNEPIEAEVITRALNRINRPRKQLPEILNGIRMDIGTNTEFAVNNSAAQLAVDGDMQIGGTASKPGATGRITVKENGRIGYLGRNFNIERGTVDFVNPNAIVPEVDIQATREIVYQDTDYLVVLAVTGHPESLQVSVYSVPELPKPEVVALVITGRTREVNTVSKSQGVGGKAVNYIVEGLKGKVEERLAQTFGLEKVTLAGTVTDPTLIRMGIEKRFIGRMKVSYSSGFENLRQQQVGIEYEINRNVSLYSLYDLENREAGAGIDFNVKRW